MALLADPRDNKTVYVAGPAGPAKHPGATYASPGNEGRRNVVLHTSHDGARSWDAPAPLAEGYAGYSSMSGMPGGGIALLYETATPWAAAAGCKGSCSVVFSPVAP